MADHEDYLPGEAPAAHHGSHENLGSDEINVGGLSGQLADNQPCIAHDLGGAKHNADTLANLNAKVSDATLMDDDAVNALIGLLIGFHAALPTVHQDAPDLILTHKGDASAHHAKYTDADAVAALAAVDAILGTDFDATTFLYATLDNTPEPKTPAEVMAILSGQAAATFDLNNQDLIGVSELKCGVDDTTSGFISLYGGAGTSGGGKIQLYMPADYDGTYDFWKIEVYTDDLTIQRVGTIVSRFTAEGDFNVSLHDGSTKGLKLAGTLVEYGANDSGGEGYKLLRVPN